MIKTTSADGTAIAADRTGSGPALVLVAPALATRAAFTPLAELLAPRFTVYAYDRRGRGDSGGAAGGSANVFGHSSGAVLALDAARNVGVTKLAVYEPPFIVDGEPMPADFANQLAGLVAADRRGDALALWMRATVGMSDEAVAR